MIKSSDLCVSCRHLELKFTGDEGNYGFTVKEFLDEHVPNFNRLAPDMGNGMLYSNMLRHGGCFKCIALIAGAIDNEVLSSANEGNMKVPEIRVRLVEYRKWQKEQRYGGNNQPLPKTPQRARSAEEQSELDERKPYLASVRESIAKYQNCIVHNIGIKSDGTVVVAAGISPEKQRMISRWRDIIAVSSGGGDIAGLKANGTVIAVGDNKYGQCNTSGWRNIVAVSSCSTHTAGLKADGTVVAVGDNKYGQCDTSGWRDIVAVSSYGSRTVGLKADGTVVAAGDTNSILGKHNTSRWRDITAIYASSNTVGIKADGTVVDTGEYPSGHYDTSGWRDIVAVCAGNPTVGLSADGTVVTVGSNNYGQFDTSSWRDIVAVSSCSTHTTGLKADGTVVAVGDNKYGQCDTSGWRDIVAVSSYGISTIGLKADGTVVFTGGTNDSKRNLSEWRNIGPRIPKGICRHCGGRMSGVFTKKCNSCGQPA